MAMSDADVHKQLQQMINFINKEAEEKASEIEIKAEQEFEIEKNNIVLEERKKMNQEFERKLKQVEVKRKIARSNDLNQSRLKVLAAREEAVQGMYKVASQRLVEISNRPDYRQLLEALVVQGLLKLGEDNVLIACREKDHDLVEGVIESAANEYKSKTDKQVKITVSKQHRLNQHSAGGVLLSANEGRILCNNTLEQRLQLAYEGLLPEIRIILFGRSESRKFVD